MTIKDQKILGLLLSLSMTACTANSSLSSFATATPTSSATPSATPTAASGIRAAKIIFKLTANGGSFPSPSTLGTPAIPGSGLQATTIYNTDGTVLASNGPSGSNWPTWLSSFELGVSGAANTSSQNSHCAKFADSTEASLINCNIGPSPSPTPASCGASTGQFRVSEVDCTAGTPAASDGNGGGSDGVYLRAKFNRDTSALGAAENMMVTLEYVVSALNPAPANPANCFSTSDGTFSPESCSDFVWRAYIKHAAGDIVQPFLLLVPPTYSSILSSGQTSPSNSGSGVVAKQFVVPLAGDSAITVLQISRTKSAFPSASNLLTYCTSAGSTPGDSPLCAGIIFYSISFYRI